MEMLSRVIFDEASMTSDFDLLLKSRFETPRLFFETWPTWLACSVSILLVK